ncbi:MAG: hypothetical protein ACLSAH_00870 [Bilophila wadsworthia]
MDISVLGLQSFWRRWKSWASPGPNCGAWPAGRTSRRAGACSSRMRCAPDGQGPSAGRAEGSRSTGLEEAGQDIPEVARTDEAILRTLPKIRVWHLRGERIDGIGSTMRIESSSGAVEGRTDAVQTDGMQELARLLERVGGGTLPRRSCTSCNSCGMLGTGHGRGELSQQVNQGFESLLKQQG